MANIVYQTGDDETLNYLKEAYRQYAEVLPDNMEGSFAFAIYDKNKNYIFCARDSLGIAPLYYTQTPNGYKFASSIDTLLALPSVVKKPNLHSLGTMIRCFAVDYYDTMYEGIYRLPPGHKMIIENGKKYIERYWFPEKIKINYTIGEEEAAHELKALFARAVDRSVSTLAETAFELSGGLDSSSVVSLLAQKADPSQIDSYSMSFEDLKCDEGSYVDALLVQYPLKHQKIPVGKLDYHNKFSLESLYALSPNWPISLTFAMIIPMLKQMKEDGKKVVVSGQGGDHLFTGSAYVLYDLLVRGKFRAFYDELKTHRRPWSAFKAYVLKPFLGDKRVDKLKGLLGKVPLGHCFWNTCTMVNMTDLVGIKNHAIKDELDAVTTACHSTVMDGNIFHCAQQHFGIQYRHPFFDKGLVEFALSLPPEMKYGNRTIKRILRKAMEGVLPEKINRRGDKAEFSELIRQQINAVDLSTFFDDPHIVRLGVVEKDDVAQCVEMYRNGKLRYVSYLWTLINVEFWYRYNQFDAQEVEKE